MKIKVLGASPYPQQMITWVARFSHRSHNKSSPEADAKLFKTLFEREHWSALEFNRWTVRICLDALGEIRDALQWLAEHRGWELSLLGPSVWCLSGNARSLLEGLPGDLEGSLNWILRHSIANEPGWGWLHNLGWWEGVLEQPQWGDYYIYEPSLEYLPPEERAKHAAALFVFRDVSRVFTHQIVRHRLCSFMQESMRYTFVDEARYVVPKTVLYSEWGEDIYRNAIGNAFAAYWDLMEKHNIPREDARFVLPIGAKTTLIVMASLREWAHIIKLRTSKAAQWEIREKIEWVRDVFLEQIPWFKEVLNA